MGFVADVVGGVADAVGSVVSGVADAVGGVVSTLGPLAPIAATIAGMPYLAPSGFAALEAPSILGGGLTGAGMMTSGALASGIGGSMLTTAGGLGLSTAFSGADSFINALGGFAGGTPNATGFGNLVGSLGNLVSGSSQSLLPGEVGGIPTSTFSKFSNLIRGGMDIYNALNYGTGQSPTAAQQNADPYAPYRSQAATQLNQLMANPNLVYGLPGYQFAQEQGSKAIARQAASTGQAMSGGTLAALQKQATGTAKDWFDNYVSQLSLQAGATPQNAVAGQAAYSTAADYQAKAEKARQTALLQGLSGVASGVSSFFG
jgi:hypothetical protein